jgi:hypothetical protein
MDIDDEDSNASGNSDPEPEPLLELMEGKDNESEGHSSDESAKGFVNPLAPKKSKKVDGEISDGEWSDESEGNGKKKSKAQIQREKKEKKALGKRNRKDNDSDDEDRAKDFFGRDTVEVVAANDPGALEK